MFHHSQQPFSKLTTIPARAMFHHSQQPFSKLRTRIAKDKDGFKPVSRAQYQKAPAAAEGVSKSIKVKRFGTGLQDVPKRINNFGTLFDTAVARHFG